MFARIDAPQILFLAAASILIVGIAYLLSPSPRYLFLLQQRRNYVCAKCAAVRAFFL
jgi:hypothetical protein